MNKLFDYKRKYIASDGDTYVNLSIPAYDVSKIRISSIHKLSQDNNARIDTFAYNMMNNMESIDALMYANHIYNPFAVQEEDILYVPVGDDNYYTQEEPELIDGSTMNKNINSEKSKTYAETVEYLARLGLGIK